MTASTWENLYAQWEVLPDRLGGHIGLTLTALLIGAAISLPLGIYAAKHRKVEKAVITTASLIQTIPSLALLALMVVAWGTIGWGPAVVALILYSLLPMIRNTVTGLKSVDPAALEAAQGIGMTERQTLWMVSLPLAMPTILAGVRTATVWVIGLATIAQPVGATSLGNYIFTGLSTGNTLALLFGCVFAALLALVFDGLIYGLEKAAELRSPLRAVLVAAGIALVALSPVILDLMKPAPIPVSHEAFAQEPGQAKRTIVIGGKGFTEQFILDELVELQLRESGFETEVKDGLGSTVLVEALINGQVDVAIDYTGTVWTNLMKRKDMVNGPEMNIEVAAFLYKEYGVICLGTLGFDNSYAFAMSRPKAEELGVTSIADLSTKSEGMKAGTGMEFFGRPEWQTVRQRYGLGFDKTITMDPALMYQAIHDGNLDAVVAFSTDGRIDAYDLKLLDDPAKALPPYEAVLLVSAQAAGDPRLVAALRPLLNRISTEQMRAANRKVDIDRMSPTKAAKWLRREILPKGKAAPESTGGGS